jgi:hypothetical protein
VRSRHGAALFAIASVALAACDRPPRATATSSRPPTASASVRPSVLGIGATAVVRLRIEVPRGYRITDIAAPSAVAGFEIVRRETLPIESTAARDVHLRAFHLRALRVGAWMWPATAIALADPEGRDAALQATAVSVEVRSVLRDFPGRTAPFGARAPPPVPSLIRFDPIAGALIAVALAAAIAVLVRRRRVRATRLSPNKPTPPWTHAREEFARARGAVATDAAAAADTTAVALRSYMIDRFGAAAAAATTEELATATPPFGATSRWPDFVTLMRELDALRFPRADRSERARRSAAVEALLGRAEVFVEASLPPEPLR